MKCGTLFFAALLLGFISTPFSRADSVQIETERARFLSMLKPTDQLIIQWTSFKSGNVKSLRKQFHLELQPVLTWNSWQESFFSSTVEQVLPRGTYVENEDLGTITINGSDIIAAVRKAGDVAGNFATTQEKAGFKIAVDLSDSLPLLIAAVVRNFNPAFIDIQELISKPSHTETFLLTYENAEAKIVVSLQSHAGM